MVHFLHKGAKLFVSGSLSMRNRKRNDVVINVKSFDCYATDHDKDDSYVELENNVIERELEDKEFEVSDSE